MDTREKPHAIVKILAHFERQGIEVVRQKLDAGDYMIEGQNAISVDRKQNLLEVCSNLCQDHERFIRECERAREAGTKLVVLVEHGGKVKSLEDVAQWINPRLKVSPYAVSGRRLYRMMHTTATKYGIEWAFCRKDQTGQKIVEILSRG